MVRIAEIHLALHMIHVLLGVLYHLNCLLPLLLKSSLRLLNLLFLHLHPPVDLLLLSLERPWGELVLLEQLLDVPALLLLFELEDVLAELDQLRLLAVLHDDLQLLLRVLLEGVPVEQGVARLTCPVVHRIAIHSICTESFEAIGLDRGLGLPEVVFAVRDAVGRQGLL